MMQEKNSFENKKVKSYRQFQLIDRSNFEVYKVVDLEDNNTYKAIKVFPKHFLIHNPGWIPGIRSEVNTLKKCRHQNIIRFYEFLETPNNYYLVMEYCKDGNLLKYLEKKGGRLSESEAIDIFKQLLNGYHELYTQKIMHRDLKLSNILMNEGIVKLADFGFAKEAQVSDSNVGTQAYKAPDVSKSELYDYKVDIWSLGICLYELLFGRVPFKDNGRINESWMNIKEWKLEFLEGINVSEETKGLLREMLTLDPKQRIDWTGVFGHQLFRNSQNSCPFTASDIFLLSKSVENVENEEKMLIKLKKEEEKTDEGWQLNYESEVDCMKMQEIQAKAFAKDLEYKNFKKKVRYIELRYLHHSNVLRNMAFVLERGLRLDPELNDAIYVYTVLSKKLLILTEEFLKRLEMKQWVFVKEDYNESAFEEFKTSLFHQQLLKVIEDEYRSYETFITKGVFKQFQGIEYSNNQFFKVIKMMNSEAKPDFKALNETFLNVLRDYLFMKIEELQFMKEKEKKRIWTQMFYLYHCYQYMDFKEDRWELMFDDTVEDGFDFLKYRELYRNMEEFSSEEELRELIRKRLFA